jgi:antitoxin component of RelBE/YafQ-DinJ toxin-antitoxin module
VGAAIKLKDVRVAKIALVERPANQRPLLLLKSEDSMADKKNDLTLSVAESLIPLLKTVAAEPVAAETAAVEAVKGDLTADEQAALTMAARVVKTLAGKMDAGRFALLMASAGYTPPVPEAKDMLTKSAHDAAVKVAVDAAVKTAVEEALAKAKLPTPRIIKTAAGTEIDISKIPEDQRAPFEAMAKELDAKDAEIKKAAAEKRTSDLLVKSKAAYPSLDHAKIADALGKLSGDGGVTLEKSAASGVVKTLEEVLAQAEALAKAGFAEIGARGGDAGGSVWAQIEAGGAALLAKGGGKLTKEQAVSEFLKTAEGKALEKAYRAERAS